jgi:archaetidylinositol phosphate synthase
MLDHWLSSSKFKESYEKFVQKLLKNKISANKLTIIGLIIGLVSALFIFLSGIIQDYFLPLYLSSIILMIISFIFDTFDGPIARLRVPTEFGGVLDIFCDRFVEVSIIIAFVSTDPIRLIYPGLISLGAMVLCISMFLLSGILTNANERAKSPKVIPYRKGFIERSETFMFFLLIDIFFTLRTILLWMFALFVLMTAFLRLYGAYRIFKA